MNRFEYVAIDARGRRKKGIIEAEDAAGAESTLAGAALMVAELRPTSRAPAAGSWDEPGSDSPREKKSLLDAEIKLGRLPMPTMSQDRIRFLRDLSLMLRSGVTLLTALELIAGQSRRPSVTKASRAAAQSVSSGQPLARALEARKGFLPSSVLRLIESAEVTGRMEEALARGAEFIERRAEHRATILTSLFYPTFVLLAAIGVSIFLVTGVIPRIAEFVAKRGRGLPPTTQNLVDLSRWFNEHGAVVGIVTALLLVAILLFYRTKPGRRAMDRLFLSIPVLKSVLTNGEMSQLGWSLSMMLDSGVSISEGLDVCSRASFNQAISTRLDRAGQRLLEGRTLSDSLADPLIPKMFLEVVSVGENTGSLGAVLRDVGEYYGSRLKALVKRLSSFVEPGTILLVGGIVGYVYYAFFQALVSIAG